MLLNLFCSLNSFSSSSNGPVPTIFSLYCVSPLKAFNKVRIPFSYDNLPKNRKYLSSDIFLGVLTMEVEKL